MLRKSKQLIFFCSYNFVLELKKKTWKSSTSWDSRWVDGWWVVAINLVKLKKLPTLTALSMTIKINKLSFTKILPQSRSQNHTLSWNVLPPLIKKKQYFFAWIFIASIRLSNLATLTSNDNLPAMWRICQEVDNHLLIMPGTLDKRQKVKT